MFERVQSTLKILRIENNFLKALFRANIIQFFIIVILIFSIISLFPLKENVPYLVHFSNAQMNFVSVKKANSDITEDEMVRLSLIMAYVLNREVKNNIDDKKRHEVVRLQSSMKVWKTFEVLLKDDKSIFRQEGLTRDINLINFHIVPDTNIAQIDFQATVKDDEKIKKQSNYRAVVEFVFEDETLKFEDMPNNPTTFKVINYQVSKIN
jgi:type IV secretory pathway component VirB8